MSEELAREIEAGGGTNEAVCGYCSGTGMKRQLPGGHNAFEMSIFAIARTVVRVPCHCPKGVVPALVRAAGETR